MLFLYVLLFLFFCQQPESVEQFSKYLHWLEKEAETLHSSLQTKLNTIKEKASASTKVALSADQCNELSFDSSFGGDSSDLCSALEKMKLNYNVVEDKDYKDNSAAGSNGNKVPRKPNSMEVCLGIDLSYQESLSNLITSLSTKVQYVNSMLN